MIVNFICSQIVAHFCIAKTGQLRCCLRKKMNPKLFCPQSWLYSRQKLMMMTQHQGRTAEPRNGSSNAHSTTASLQIKMRIDLKLEQPLLQVHPSGYCLSLVGARSGPGAQITSELSTRSLQHQRPYHRDSTQTHQFRWW